MKKLDLVLIIDDDHTSLFITKNVLKRSSAAEKIITSSNGKDALEHILSHCGRPDSNTDCPTLILVDVSMPVMNGFEFVKAVHELSLAKNPIIYMLTTSSHPRDIARAESLGVDGYMVKPLTKEQLEALLESLSPDTL